MDAENLKLNNRLELTDNSVLEIIQNINHLENLNNQIELKIGNKGKYSLSKRIQNKKSRLEQNNCLIKSFIDSKKLNLNLLKQYKNEKELINDEIIMLNENNQSKINSFIDSKTLFKTSLFIESSKLQTLIDDSNDKITFFNLELESIENNLILLKNDRNPKLKYLNINNKNKTLELINIEEEKLLEYNLHINECKTNFNLKIKLIEDNINKSRIEYELSNLLLKKTEIDDNISNTKLNKISQKIKNNNRHNIKTNNNDDIENLKNELNINNKSINILKTEIRELETKYEANITEKK